MAPKRIQRKRQRGWRKPPNTVIIDRTSRWGNPYKVVKHENEWRVEGDGGCLFWGSKDAALEVSLSLYRQWVLDNVVHDPDWLAPLRGKDLACFCKENVPCHGDVLLNMAAETGANDAARET